MKNDPREELCLNMGLEIRDQLMDHPEISGEKIRDIVAAITKGWSVTRKDFPNTDQHPLEDDSYGHRLVLTGPFVPESDEETAERKAWEAARSWAWRARQFSYDPQDPGYDNGQCPAPPERVGASQLLDQGIWWRMRTERDPVDKFTSTEAIRLEDMTHDHRLALLAFLRRNAPRYKIRADWAMTSGPQPSGDAACDAFEAACDQQWETSAAEWIEDRPLVAALVYWTTPVAESPLTWRPMVEAPCGAEAVVVVRYPSPDGEQTAQVSPSLAYGWVTFPDYDPLMVSDGLGGFDYADPTEWRELRDDELPTPVEPFDQDWEHATWRPMNEAPTDGTVIMARWDDAGMLDEPERIRWNHHGWYLLDADEPLDDDTANVGFSGWRELRDDELSELTEGQCGYRDEN